MERATNAVVMRKRNQNYLLRLIRSGECSRASLAEQTGLTKASVSKLVSRLIEKDLIYETESDYVGVGRKPILLKIKGDVKKVLAISIDRQRCSVGIINLSGAVLIEETFSLKGIQSMDELMDRAISLLKQQMKAISLSDYSQLLGIGVIVSGPVDSQNNRMIATDWSFSKCEYDFNIYLQEFNLPVYVENDSNAYAIYDQCFGSCRNIDNFISVLWVHGIGAGVVVDGKLYHGLNGYCNELGHISIDYNGKQCLCGNRGCLVAYAGRESILAGTPYQGWAEVIDAGDEELIDKEAEYLATALASALNLLGLEKVVLHGEICYKGEIIANKLSEKIAERILTKEKIDVLVGEERSDILVAGSLCVSDFFYREIDIER
ncbi:MAG: ROK family transcriptional regulator [Ruminococcaceae bacterium]|nr:ROK family transcriptional regulator [Oscillospiraceae bacterium]